MLQRFALDLSVNGVTQILANSRCIWARFSQMVVGLVATWPKHENHVAKPFEFRKPQSSYKPLTNTSRHIPWDILSDLHRFPAILWLEEEEVEVQPHLSPQSIGNLNMKSVGWMRGGGVPISVKIGSSTQSLLGRTNYIHMYKYCIMNSIIWPIAFWPGLTCMLDSW